MNLRPLILLIGFALPAAQAAMFPMGVWYEGGVGEKRFNLIPEDPSDAAKQYDRDFDDIARHGINIVVVPNSPPPHHRPLLDAADLWCLVHYVRSLSERPERAEAP